MGNSASLQKKKAARLNLLAVLAHLDEEINALERTEKKPKRDFSAVDARVEAMAMRKFKKLGLV